MDGTEGVADNSHQSRPHQTSRSTASNDLPKTLRVHLKPLQVGTSTGAIVAVSLGTLHMSLDQVEAIYTKLGRVVGARMHARMHAACECAVHVVVAQGCLQGWRMRLCGMCVGILV